MDGMQHGAGGRIEGHSMWSVASRLGRTAYAVLAYPLRRATSTDDTHHQNAIAARQPQRARPSFAVTPTLYFHANTNAAVALTVGVESVAIDSPRVVGRVRAES